LHKSQQQSGNVVTIFNAKKGKIGIISPTFKPGKYSQAFLGDPSAEKLIGQAR
jgi:hypothetical protein